MDNREEVANMVAKMYAGLKQGGVMYFTLFGTQDFRTQTKPETVFIDDFTPPGNIIYKAEEYYLGVTGLARLKYWHVHSFVAQKSSKA